MPDNDEREYWADKEYDKRVEREICQPADAASAERDLLSAIALMKGRFLGCLYVMKMHNLKPSAQAEQSAQVDIVALFQRYKKAKGL